MQTLLEPLSSWISEYPLLETVLYASGLILLSAIVNQIVKKILVRGFYHILKLLTQGESDDFGVEIGRAHV